jgi:hypothetical protein
MRMTTLLLPTLLVAFAGGCKSKQPIPDPATSGPTSATTEQVSQTPDPANQDLQAGPDSVYFSMERTACFGSCPSYKVTIDKDGNAVYEGRRFAPREGRFVGKVDAVTMKELYDKAVAVGFFGMEDKYDRAVTDLPSTIIRVHAQGKDKQVIGRVGPPQGFKDLAQEAERILAPVEWTRTGDLR